MNTDPRLGGPLWLLWHDGAGIDDCRLSPCRRGVPCQVRRQRVTAWSAPCSSLPHGCGSKCGHGDPSRRVIDQRLNAAKFSRPWIRARYGLRTASFTWRVILAALLACLAIALTAAVVLWRPAFARPGRWRLIPVLVTWVLLYRVCNEVVYKPATTMRLGAHPVWCEDPAMSLDAIATKPPTSRNVENGNDASAAELPPSTNPPRRCRVRGGEQERVAICFYGMIRNIRFTIDSLNKNLIEPIRAVHAKQNAKEGLQAGSYNAFGAVDVLVHTLLVETLTSSNEFHADAVENSVKVGRADFLHLEPCRYIADDQALVDDRPMGHSVQEGQEFRPGYDGTTAINISRVAKQIARFRLPGKRKVMAELLGVRDVGIKHYSDGMITNVLRAYYSLEQVMMLMRVHERARGWRYTTVIATRPDVAILSPINYWRIAAQINTPLNSESPILVPNFAHNGGVNDRFAIGRRHVMLKYMKRFDFIRRFWYKHLNASEGIVCELVRKLDLRIGVMPMCVVRTRAMGTFVQEVLNKSKDPMGLPLGCANIRLVENGESDHEFPCPSEKRRISPAHVPLDVAQCLERKTSLEPLNSSEPTNLIGSTNWMTSMKRVKCQHPRPSLMNLRTSSGGRPFRFFAKAPQKPQKPQNECIITKWSSFWLVHRDGTRSHVAHANVACYRSATTVSNLSIYPKAHGGQGSYFLDRRQSSAACQLRGCGRS